MEPWKEVKKIEAEIDRLQKEKARHLDQISEYDAQLITLLQRQEELTHGEFKPPCRHTRRGGDQIWHNGDHFYTTSRCLDCSQGFGDKKHFLFSTQEEFPINPLLCDHVSFREKMAWHNGLCPPQYAVYGGHCEGCGSWINLKA